MKLVHHFVFLLQGVLKIVDHSLLDLFEFLDSLFIGLSDRVMLVRPIDVRVGDGAVVVFSVKFFGFFRISAHL